jgi:hypothetical protein
MVDRGFSVSISCMLRRLSDKPEWYRAKRLCLNFQAEALLVSGE